jgi:predicted ATPase
MLFSISGSQGAGKTTLLNYLKEHNNVNIVERKTSRSIQHDWGYTLAEINRNVELTMKFQFEILARKLADEHQYVIDNNINFTERTYADLFTYALVVLGKEPTCSDFIDVYYRQCKAAQGGYRKVFYLTAGHFPVEQDVHRASANYHYCRLIDNAMLDFTQQITDNSNMIIIDTSVLAHRAQLIMENLQK